MGNKRGKKQSGFYICILVLVFMLLYGKANPVYATSYEYDRLGRVSKVIYEDGTYETYAYDKNGNITRHSISDGTGGPVEEDKGEDSPSDPEPPANGKPAGADSKPGNHKENIPVAGIRITGISGKIAAGKTIQLAAEITPANATEQAVVWSSSNTQYATVTETGKVSVKKAGAGKSVTITAGARDGSNIQAVYKISIMKDSVKKIKLTVSKKEVKAGKSVRIKAKITTSGKKVNKSLQWSSSNENYAVVNKSGKVRTKKEGKGKTVTITARATDGSGKTAKIKLKIK